MLKGKVVVIDPGHGGDATGAIGPTGLKEKDVNLSVALMLAEMLKAAGASVYLTRDGDYDIPLADRVKFSLEKKADAFVSIHHNANARRDSSVDRTEIYCVFEPDSPSFDLGYLLFYSFRKYLGLPTVPPLPARYRVLKGNVPVSVLGEASYITNPAEEKKLATEEYRRKEALAYYEALKMYFDRGVPMIKNLDVNVSKGLVTAEIVDEDGMGIDASSISLLLDGKPLEFEFAEGRWLAAELPELLPNGEHVVELKARNLNGNVTPPSRYAFKIKRRAESFAVTPYPENSRNPLMVTIRLVDSYGMPIAEGERVIMSVPSGKILAIQPHADADGCVRAVIRFEEAGGNVEIKVRDFEGVGMVKAVRRKSSPYLFGKLVDINERPIEGATVKVKNRHYTTVLGGYFLIPLPIDGPWTLEFKKRGFYPTSVEVTEDELDDEQRVVITPMFGGVLLGRKIIVDPAIGGRVKGREYLPGLTSSRANLFVAKMLYEMLFAAGADVVLTRSDEETTVEEVERVKQIIDEGGDLLVSIDHRDSDRYMEPGTHFYYRDTESMEFSKRISRLMGKLLDVEVDAREWSSYLIIHPPMTRSLVVFPELSTSRMDDFVKRAYVLLLSIVEHLGFRPVKYSGLLLNEKRDPIPDAMVISEEQIATYTDERGRFAFLHLRPEPQILKIITGGKSFEVEIDPVKGKPEEVIL